MSFFFTLTNVLLLFLFWKACRSNAHAFYFNPYLSVPDRLLDKVLDYAQPILPGLPKRYVAILVFLFLLAFRNLLFPGLDTMPLADIGGGLAFPSLFGRIPRLYSAMLTGTICFLQFLLSVWGAFLLIKLLAERASETRIYQAYEDLVFPFSKLKPWPMFAVLVLLHALLALILSIFMPRICYGLAGSPESQMFALARESIGQQLLSSIWLGAMATITTTILFIQKLLIFFIFVSIFSLILAKRDLAVFCQEAINLILGRFANRPLLLGSFDFTPILFYMGLTFAYHFLTWGLLLLRPLFTTHL